MTHPYAPPPGRDDAIEVTNVAEVILSEEHLLVTTERRAVERVVLRKVIVTERQTITVDVSHEEIRLTHEPVAGGTVVQAGALPAAREPVVMILHEEQITVSRTIVPVERVTLTTTPVPGVFVVKETIRHEETDVDVSP
jgi:uncharacterized protein (TIGR02271 family)